MAVLDKVKNIIVFDTETTGFDGKEDRIIQISAIKCTVSDDGQLIEGEKLNEYINPGFLISEKITDLTGITNEVLARHDSEYKVFSDKILPFFGERPAIAAYNSPFDVKFMQNLYKRYGKSFKPQTEIDVLSIARKTVPRDYVENYKLKTIADYLKVSDNAQFHNSMEDTTVTRRVLERLSALSSEQENAFTQLSFFGA